MRILLIHADKFEYEITGKAIPKPEPLENLAKSGAFRNVLVAFCTVEESDERREAAVAQQASEAIAEIARSVATKSVLVYPYAHLSSNLASPDPAISILNQIQTKVSGLGYKVDRSPFGYYKKFDLSCLGHPLSELSRTITGDVTPSERAPIQTEYEVMDLNGKLHAPENYHFEDRQEDFRALVEKEALKTGFSGGEPKYLEYCRKFGIEWESYSDIGHMRYGPEAVLLFDLITDYSWTLVRKVGVPVFQVKGTNMFDLSVRAVKEHADLFGARLYRIDLDEKSFVMRYAACHQQFASVKDWTLSYKSMPFGTFEVADAYRLEQSGELLLSFRTRKLHMPDFHIYCMDLQDANDVAWRVHQVIYEEIRKLGRDYVSIYNLTRSFYEANKEYILRLAAHEGKPVLLNFVPEKTYYWVLNIEYCIIDELKRPREIATFQIDIGNAERFGIRYTDTSGQPHFPPIIHTAILGTIERYLFTVLDTAARTERMGGKPELPLWLTPVQVRVIPVSSEFVKAGTEIAQKLADLQVRADIDDRDDTVPKRVREAEIRWIPYIVVHGAKEVSSKLITVRKRQSNTQAMKVEDLAQEIRSKTSGYPFRPLNIPALVSTRPGYR